MNYITIINQLPFWAQILLEERVGLNYLKNLNCLNKGKLNYLEYVCKEIKKGIPVSKVLGIKYFYKHVFFNKDVLDPRYDSEVIIDILQKIAEQSRQSPCKKILELGAGSGCLSFAALDILKDSFAVVVEKSTLAIKTLKRNVKKNNFLDRIEILQGSWWNPIDKKTKPKFDVLIFNPPYLSLSELLHKKNNSDLAQDPLMALWGGYDGLVDYRVVIPRIKEFIKQYAIIEICSEKLKAVEKILKSNNLNNYEIWNDLQGRSRMILVKVDELNKN